MNLLRTPPLHASHAPTGAPPARIGILGPRPRWTRPEPGRQTVVCCNQVVGHVVEIRGGFVSFDAACTPIGRYDSLPLARRAVAGWGDHAVIRAGVTVASMLAAVNRWADSVTSRRLQG